MEKIIIVEPGSGALTITKAIRILGYEPVILCSISEYGGDQKTYIQQQGYYEVDASHASNIVECITSNKISNILGIISTADRFITQSIEASKLLGIKGMDSALLKVNNKANVIRLIATNSPPSIIFNAYNIPYDELDKMLDHYGFLVIKPAMSAGGKGIFEIKSKKDLQEIYGSMKKEQKKQAKILEQEWIAQPKINGTLYSLEGFVANGICNVIGLSKRTRIQYTESRNEFPFDNKIDKKSYKNIRSIVEKLIKASNYKNGYFHSELIVNNNDIFLIDANFGRIGGGGIARQIALSTGKTIEEVYAHVIDVTFFGNKPEHNNFYHKKKIETLFIAYGINCTAQLINIELPKEIKGHHIQLVDNGKILQPVGYNNRSWIGLIVGKNKEVLKDMDKISIITDVGILNPVF